MAQEAAQPSRHDQSFWLRQISKDAALSPVDRISEILFGLIMVLTFTGAISVANADRQEIRELLWAALGCNVAWGIVDAGMYLMNLIVDRAHAAAVVRELVQMNPGENSRKILKEEMPAAVGALLSESELDSFLSRLKTLPPPTRHVWITGKDMLATAEIFLLVFACTFPVALPFVFVEDVHLALRISNGVALIMLFAGGYRLAQYAAIRPFVTAIFYTLLGVMMVAITMALGG